MKRLLLFDWIRQHKTATIVPAAVAAIVFFAWLIRRDRGSPAELAPATAARRSAEAFLSARSSPKAIASAGAIEILENLASGSTDLQLRFEQAAALETMALIQLARDQTDRADQFFRKAIGVWSRMLGDDPADATVRFSLGRCLSRHATLLNGSGRWEEADTTLDRGENVCAALVSIPAADERVTRELVVIEHQRGLLYLERGHVVLALERFDNAAFIQNAQIQASPASAENLELLTSVLASQARARSVAEEPQAALRKFAEARSVAERLNSEYPAIGRYQDLLATQLESEADETGRDQNGAAQARALLRRAVAIRESLVVGSPEEPAYLDRLAASCGALAESFRAGHSYSKAAEYDRRELEYRSRLQKEHPGVMAFRFGRGRALHNLAESLRQSGRTAEALEIEREAAPLLAGVYRENVLDEDHRRAASCAYWSLCNLELDRKDHRAAAKAVTTYRSIEPGGFEEPHEAAAFLCRCIALSRDDQTASPAEKEGLARSYADRAIDALRMAVQYGYRDLNELTTSHIFDLLRNRPDFAQVLQKVEAIDQVLKEG